MTNINTKELIGKTAFELLVKLGFELPPIDPFDIAKKLGISVESNLTIDHLSRQLSGSISRSSKGEILIWLNPLDDERSQRFTLAHELGHYINDIITTRTEKEILDTPITLYRDEENTPMEQAANKFAAELLMPEKFLYEKINEMKKELLDGSLSTEDFIKIMSNEFLVSLSAMTVRLKSLGILTKN